MMLALLLLELWEIIMPAVIRYFSKKQGTTTPTTDRRGRSLMPCFLKSRKSGSPRDQHSSPIFFVWTHASSASEELALCLDRAELPPTKLWPEKAFHIQRCCLFISCVVTTQHCLSHSYLLTDFTTTNKQHR